MEIEKTNYISEIKEILSSARKNVQYAINVSMVYAYYEMGRIIVEQEQHGKNRAEYGKRIIKTLSKELTKEFGNGYSEETITLIRKFYVIYSLSGNSYAVRTKSSNFVAMSFDETIKRYPLTSDGHRFCLSWTMYRVLIRIKNQQERRFYEIEAYKNSRTT